MPWRTGYLKDFYSFLQYHLTYYLLVAKIKNKNPLQWSNLVDNPVGLMCNYVYIYIFYTVDALTSEAWY